VAVRRSRILAAVAALGGVLVVAGAALVVGGLTGDSDIRTVLGILIGLAGLVCFRVLHWARRIRLMTRAGLALRADDQRDDGDPASR
jgi:drug/metabolite transporter (DMT)-like permease